MDLRLAGGSIRPRWQTTGACWGRQRLQTEPGSQPSRRVVRPVPTPLAVPPAVPQSGVVRARLPYQPRSQAARVARGSSCPRPAGPQSRDWSAELRKLECPGESHPLGEQACGSALFIEARRFEYRQWTFLRWPQNGVACFWMICFYFMLGGTIFFIKQIATVTVLPAAYRKAEFLQVGAP